MTKLRVVRADRRRGKDLSVVAAFEDASTEARVEAFCQSLEAHLGKDCGLVKQMWPVSELRLSQLRTIAAGEAAESDLIIISVHHAETPPVDIQSWAELWLARKGSKGPAVLLALFDPISAGISSELQACFKAIARRGNMELLVQCEDRSDDM